MQFLGIGPTELIIILIIILLLFGGKKLPELAKSIGKAMREFQNAQKGLAEDDETGKNDDQKTIEFAKSMKIETDGRSIDEIKKEIARKMG
jgi:sec-independent protein translocase protein TatA